MSITTIGPIDVAETKIIEFPFADEVGEGETIISAVVNITVKEGVDATPTSRLTGTPLITGTSVYERISTVQDGATYHLRAIATTDAGTVHTVAADIKAITL